MKVLSIFTIIRLILLAVMLSIFFACSSSGERGLSLQEFKQKEGETPGKASEAYWAIPEQYKNVPIEQIKSQTKITEYKTIKGAGTTAGTESMSGILGTSLVPSAKNAAVKDESDKSIKERKDLELYINKLVTLEGVVNTTGTQKTSPLEIREPEPGKYQIWFCADKNQKRKPCRNRALLLYLGPEGKGNIVFKLEDKIRFWGVILGEEIYNLGTNYKRYPRIRVLDLEVIK